jgi:hypothetical protein
MQTVRHTPSDTWIKLIFSAKAADGHVIRRNVTWIDREVGRERFITEVRARGFHLLQTADQFIVVCHSGPEHLLF